MIKFLITNKFFMYAVEASAIATGGMVAMDLLFSNLILKILIGLATLVIIIRKGYKDWNK